MINNTETSVLVNTAELEAVKNILSTARTRKKVKITIVPKEDSADIGKVARKLKKVRINISKKKKQRKILKSENSYFLIVASNIIRNEEKLNELKAKEKETKLTKIIREKFQQVQVKL